MVHDVGGNIFGRDADIFVSRHWGAEVEVFYVNCHKFCVGSGENAVDQDFDGGEVGGWGADVAFVDDTVATHGELDAFGFGFV